MLSTAWNTQRGSWSYTEKRRERRKLGGEEGESKGERPIRPVISSLSVLHSPEHPERFTELSRKEKGEGEDRGHLGEKRESQKERE